MKHSPKATPFALNQARASLQYGQSTDDSITMSPAFALAAISRPMRSLLQLCSSCTPAQLAAIRSASGRKRIATAFMLRHRRRSPR
jgi:hypothetical protein